MKLDLLELFQAATERDLKRAYARLLKIHRPDTDLEAFHDCGRPTSARWQILVGGQVWMRWPSLPHGVLRQASCLGLIWRMLRFMVARKDCTR